MLPEFSLKYNSIFRSSRAFKAVDLNSFQVSQAVYSSLNELIGDLILSSNLDDVMKIRAIYSWLLFVDVKNINFVDHVEQTTSKVLNTLKYGNSYAEAFKSLTNYLGFNSVCIQGWAKGEAYVVGSDFDSCTPNHTWNAIEINNNWYLLDCYWSLLLSRKGFSQLDDFFFLIDPKIMIYSHYPENQKWQLLLEPIAYSSFLSLPVVKPDFFKFQLHLENKFNQPMIATDGNLSIFIQHKCHLFFTSKLIQVDGHKHRTELKQHLFEELTDSHVNYYFHAPKKGNYILKLFACSSSCGPTESFSIYYSVIDFFIISNEPSSFVKPFPLSSDSSWHIPHILRQFFSHNISSAHVSCKEKLFEFDVSKKLGSNFFLKFTDSKGSMEIMKKVKVQNYQHRVKYFVDIDDILGIELYRAYSGCQSFSPICKFMVSFDQSLCGNENLHQSSRNSENISVKQAYLSLLYEASENELQNVWKVFRFLSSLTPAVLKSNFTEFLPDIFLKIKNGEEFAYTHIFDFLCRAVGLSCTTISGFVKSTGCRRDTTEQENLHMWNAVLIEEKWHLVDCQWAMKKMIANEQEETLSNSLEEFYFLSNPAKFIYSHFPQDSKWQLLERPISFREFQNQVFFKPAYFRYNLLLVNPICSYLEINSEAEFILKHNSHYEFSFSLNLQECENCLPMDNYGMLYILEDLVVFKMRFPVMGTYHLVLYIKQQEEVFLHEEICEFTVKYSGSSHVLHPFPFSSLQCWGPTSFATENNIKYSLVAPITTALSSSSTSVEIYINSDDYHRLFLSCKFHGCVRGNSLDKFVLIRKVEDRHIVTVKCPKDGEYCLEIFAGCADQPVNAYLVFQILVVCDNPPNSSVSTFPMLPTEFLGPQCSNVFFKIAPMYYIDPYIETERNYLCLSFLNLLDIHLSFKMLEIDCLKGIIDLSSYVLKQCKGGVANFVMTFPEKNMYVLQLYGSEKSSNMVNIWNVLINCYSLEYCPLEFPKQMYSWRGFLHQPLFKNLNDIYLKDREVVFQLDMPECVAVILDTDGSKQYVPFKQQKNGLWTLSIYTTFFQNVNKVYISSSSKDDKSFQCMLEYCLESGTILLL